MGLFVVTLEESDTQRKVSWSVKASDEEAADGLGKALAELMPTQDIDRQKGYGMSETVWSWYADEIV